MPDLLSAGEHSVLAELCELFVPGSGAVGPSEYIERAVAGMSPGQEDEVHSAIGVLSAPAEQRADRVALMAETAAFGLVRRLAIEAYYGDFAAPGHTGPTAWDEIGFDAPQARRVRKDWSFLSEPEAVAADGGEAETEQAEVVVVGSGAGGGLIAGELGQHGHDVLLLEAGGLHPAETHTRFELEARHRLWWPPRFASTGEDGTGPVALLAGRCVGGTTVINTKVAMRAADFDVARFHERTGLLGEGGAPFAMADLEPWYEQVEAWLGVRTRADWAPSVHRVRAGFEALGASLTPVRSYTDWNCSRCGACLTGCPTNAGKSALNTFLAPGLGRGEIRLRTHRTAERVLVDTGGATPRVTGVEWRDRAGRRGVVHARVAVLAAGALNTPEILLRSPAYTALDSPSTRLVGRTLGLHPARLVYGRFDEPQDCHLVYPISAHCLDHQRDEDGGFVIEGTTIQDPVAFAESLVDAAGRPLWGERLAGTLRDYRHWAGLLVMVNDDNSGRVELDPGGGAAISKRFSATERRRLDQARAFAVDVLRAAGAREVVWSGLSTSHVQGSARMGSDPARSVVDASGRSHDVAGLYVGDGSLIPASLSVNPSLTIMALAAKVADQLVKERNR